MNGKYSSTAKTLHWVIALLIVLQFTFIYIAEWLPREHEYRGLFFRLHFSTGFTVFLLAFWRLGYRLKNPPPEPEQGQPVWMRRSASSAHWAMYLLIFTLPFTGWMLVATAGANIDFWWLLEIPNFVAKNEEFHEQLETVHMIMGRGLLAIASAHLLAALWHHFLKKDDTLKRMLPGG